MRIVCTSTGCRCETGEREVTFNVIVHESERLIKTAVLLSLLISRLDGHPA